MRPNIAWRSCLRTSSCSSTRRSAIELNASPSCWISSWPRERDALVHAPVGERPRDLRQREDALDERSSPQPAEDDGAEQRERDGDEQLTLERVRDRERSAVGCSTMTVHFGLSHARPRPPGAPRRALLRNVLDRVDGGDCRSGVGELLLFDRGRRAAAGNQPLVVRIAMGEQPRLFVHQQRVALRPDPDAVDRAPQLFERDLGDDPAGALACCPPAARRSWSSAGRPRPRAGVAT